MKANNFYKKLIVEILDNIANQYNDNYDYLRFHKPTWRRKIKNHIKKKFRIKEFSLNNIYCKVSFIRLLPYLDGIVNLYELLLDENSKYLLVQLITYKILGYEKYKLPLSTTELWCGIAKIDKLKDLNDYIEVKFPGKNIKLYKYNLNELNIPLELYYTSSGIYNNIEIKQYDYTTENINIKVQDDDIVLVCGACWGDTALFFANEINKNGHVYSFEFIPGNIDVFNKNIGINPNLKEKITLVPYPLDEISDKKLYYIDNGPASRVSVDNFLDSQEVNTICIDDFFDKYELSRVNFIKMDIEGAELHSLKGAKKILEQFKPKLAISIYHSMDDFVNIAAYLHSLNLGYNFYLKHGTIHEEETVLLAISSQCK